MKVHANRRTPEYVLEMLGNSSAQHFFFFAVHGFLLLDEDTTTKSLMKIQHQIKLLGQRCI